LRLIDISDKLWYDKYYIDFIDISQTQKFSLIISFFHHY